MSQQYVCASCVRARANDRCFERPWCAERETCLEQNTVLPSHRSPGVRPDATPSRRERRHGARRPTVPPPGSPPPRQRGERPGTAPSAVGEESAGATAREGSATRLPGIPLTERRACRATALAGARPLAGASRRLLRIPARIALHVGNSCPLPGDSPRSRTPARSA